MSDIPTISISELPLDDILLKKLEASKELKVLIVGYYQVGKSALINSLFFKEGEKYVKREQKRFTLMYTTFKHKCSVQLSKMYHHDPCHFSCPVCYHIYIVMK